MLRRQQDAPKPRKRAIIYCRVSTDKQEQDGESLEYQEEKCRRYAELHDMDAVLVLHEVKSGFIHYSLREKLTLARQFIRDHLADAIIVWDLRRFSRNFVHSAMIFEEIESVGAEIISVSENIDNSLTGKLIRSILAWSAESEREKILEYANRHWQTRLEKNLPMGTGRAPYGWAWGDQEKTFYVINQEEASVRFSIFHMFVVEDMSLRGIAHKLTEDGILPPSKSRGHKVKSLAWQPSTVHLLLKEQINIGILRILKTTTITTETGHKAIHPNVLMKTIPDGLPALIPPDLYERAQRKLKTNQREKSHQHSTPEDFLLKGHVICKSCGYRMLGRYRTSKKHSYAFYTCEHHNNKYDACPDLPMIRTLPVDQLVWEDCCRVFERLDLIRETLSCRIDQSLQNYLEDTQGKKQMMALLQDIALAKEEQAKFPENSYFHNLAARDIREKEETLRKYEAQYQESRQLLDLSAVYTQSVFSFLEFLNVMKGRYHEATFQEKRNALDVLGVRVTIHPRPTELPPPQQLATEQQWFTLKETAHVINMSSRTLTQAIHDAKLLVNRSVYPYLIHRDEINRFLRESPIRTRRIRQQQVAPRLDITYTPIFTGVQQSFG
jgi:site-specific DNA recombinase